MGYTTNFTGEIAVTPPLSADEADFLARFARTRHCEHQPNLYFAMPGLLSPAELLQLGRHAAYMHSDCPRPGSSCYRSATGAPGLWCQWVPGTINHDTGEFTSIEWNGGEKFYDYAEWMKFLIQHFLMPGAFALTGSGLAETGSAAAVMSPAGHVLNGVIEWRGEEDSDMGQIIVKDNAVMIQRATRAYGGFDEV